MNKILIIGSGAFASGLYTVLSENKDNEISMYSTNSQQLENFAKGINFFNKPVNQIKDIYNDLDEALIKPYAYIVLATPSNTIKEIIFKITKKIKTPTIIINSSKAMFDINFEQYFKTNNKNISYCALYGPSFAIELVEKNYTVCNLISSNINLYENTKKLFDNSWFKLVYFHDIKVAEFFSEIKNICAIGFGLSNAIVNKINIISIIFTIMIKELLKLLFILNIENIYLFEYFSLGDIYLTCNSAKSRNYQFGFNLIKTNDNQFTSNNTIEGIKNIHKYKGIFLNPDYGFIFFKYLILAIEGSINPNDFIDLIFKGI